MSYLSVDKMCNVARRLALISEYESIVRSLVIQGLVGSMQVQAYIVRNISINKIL